MNKRENKREETLQTIALITICLLIILGMVCINIMQENHGRLFKEKTISQEDYDIYESHLIEYGDTLWGYAEQYKSDNQTIKEYITMIKQANNKYDDTLKVGRYIILLRQSETKKA